MKKISLRPYRGEVWYFDSYREFKDKYHELVEGGGPLDTTMMPMGPSDGT